MTDIESFRRLLKTPTSPELGPGPRAGVEALRPLQSQLDEVLGPQKVSHDTADALRALILLWHDHHDAAHSLVQDGATADASYVHGILHRREPDYGNARYWFQRVGRHAAFAGLAKQAEPLLAAQPTWQARLMPRGEWDAFAFIEACEKAGRAGADGELLRRLQAVEFAVLLEYLCAKG